MNKSSLIALLDSLIEDATEFKNLNDKLDAVCDILDAAREFVRRVERGEIHSVKTYGKFKSAFDIIDA